MIRRFIYRMMVSTLVLMLLWLAGLGWFLLQIPRAPVQDLAKTDAIVVLTGGAGRIDYGLRLLAEGKAKRMFISGMETKLTPGALLTRMPEEDRHKLEEKADSVIMLGFDARNTIGNAMETARWMRDHNLHSIRLVTANYHMPRAEAEFRFSLPGVVIVPDPVLTDDFRVPDLWHDREDAKLVLSEYHKLLAAHLRHFLLVLTGDA